MGKRTLRIPVDDKTRERLDHLFRLAADSGASLEERRTAALILVEGLAKERRPEEASQEPVWMTLLEGNGELRPFVAPFTLICQACGVSVVKGTEAKLKGPFVFHAACYRA